MWCYLTSDVKGHKQGWLQNFPEEGGNFFYGFGKTSKRGEGGDKRKVGGPPHYRMAPSYGIAIDKDFPEFFSFYQPDTFIVTK